MPKASKKLLDALNEALSEELGSIIQYLWHHIMARGLESAAIADMFKDLSMVEMNHAYKIAERVDVLGGVPTTAVGPIKVGGGLQAMLRDDLAAEKVAVEMYERLVDLAGQENDHATQLLLIEILRDTEEHASQLENILSK